MTIIKDFMDKSNRKFKRNKKGKTARNLAIGAGVGTAVGLAAGMLLAPKSGKETREDIVKNAKSAVDNVKVTITDAKDKIAEFATGLEGKKAVKDDETTEDGANSSSED